MIIQRIRNIIRLNWTATARLNYLSGGLSAVFRMPIKVFGKLCLSISNSGSIILPLHSPKNTVIINNCHEDYTASSGKSQLTLNGMWKIDGNISIGTDCCIVIEKGATLTTGSNTFIGRDTQIHCSNSVTIGNGVFAGEMYICDSTVHRIIRNDKEQPLLGSVIIGDGCYLGFRTSLLKDTIIPPFSVVGSNSVCTKDYSSQGTEKLFICGNPAVVKHNNTTALL